MREQHHRDDGDPRAAAAAVARQSYGRLVAFLSARTRDVAAAEDALSEAFAAALTAWPETGIPRKPEAWLLTVAKRKQIDESRRRAGDAGARLQLGVIAELVAQARSHDCLSPDNRLALMFACAHPAIDQGLHAPLILQTILGFDAATIASAFLISPATMAQRLVRAKAKIKLAGISLQLPDRDELPTRLDGVLQAIYAAYARGWSDVGGGPALAGEALWLGSLVADFFPESAEAFGLLALMLYGEARRPARRAGGVYVPLSEQDTDLWRYDMIEQAEQYLRRAGRLASMGRFQIEAAIQSVHAARRNTGRTDWQAILQFYDVLASMVVSPVVAINRAVAIGEVHGPSQGLAALDQIAEGATSLADYQPYWAARAELLARDGRTAAAVAAVAAFDRAIGLEYDPAVRSYLQARRNRCLPA